MVVPLQAGADFAGYTIVRRLGSGPIADVYLATHPDQSRYALKIPFTTKSQDKSFALRFGRNGSLAKNMHHPNICALHDIGEFGDHVWAASGYVGSSAADLVRHFPYGIPAEGASAIVARIGAALDYLHENGCWHRAVKPTNILLDELESVEPFVVLSDFVLSSRLGQVGAADLDPTTLAYTAPEEVLDASAADSRVDQYGLAAVALHLLTGAAPFDGDLTAVVTQLISAPPPKPSDRRPELAQLDAVFTTALAKNPADRYPRCSDFAAALAEATRG